MELPEEYLVEVLTDLQVEEMLMDPVLEDLLLEPELPEELLALPEEYLLV